MPIGVQTIGIMFIGQAAPSRYFSVNHPTLLYIHYPRVHSLYWIEIIFQGRCGGSIGSEPDFWGRGPGFESGVSHNGPWELQDHCVIL